MSKRRPPRTKTHSLSRKADPAVFLRAALLAVAILVAYFPVHKATYIWDDDELVVGNAQLHSPSGIWQIWFHPMTLGSEEHYWPLNYTTLWLERQIVGESPSLSHIINALLHLANAFLIWSLFRRLGIAGAWFGALLFALHPVHVEAVAWILERNGLLACLFYLLAFGAYWNWLEGGARKFQTAGLLYFALALLSKSSAVTLPVALLVVTWWKSGRLERRDFLRVLPLFAIGLILAGGDFLVVRFHHQTPSGLTLAQRVVLAGREFWFYLEKWFWPYPLMGVYPRWPVQSWSAGYWAYPVALVVLSVLLWVQRLRIGRGPFAAMAFFLITMSPLLGFVDFNYMSHSYVADRFSYLATIGLAALCCAGGSWIVERIRIGPGLARSAGAVICFVLAALTFHRANAFESLHTFSEDVLKNNPEAWDALVNEGNWLRDTGRVDEAISLFERALVIAPDVAIAHNSLGNAYTQKGDHPKALSEYEKAVELKSDFAIAEHNIGLEYYNMGQLPKAVEHFTIAHNLDPNNPDIDNNYRAALQETKRAQGTR